MTYWDTSALLKLYITEDDSAYFLQILSEQAEPILSSEIAAVEVLCALHRKEQAGDLIPGGARAVFRQFLGDAGAGRIVTVPYGSDILAEAEKLVQLAFHRPRPVLIRSLDVIHVSSAAVSKAEAMVATDRRLREVASLVRMKVLP